jgi:DNA invertase Pin-like site-specific DNA recombinase
MSKSINTSKTNINMRTKVFAYLRVSSPAQAKDDKDGFPRQEKAVKDYAGSHNMTVIQIYREAISGTKDTEYRPVLAELIVSLEQNHHGVKTVLIERLDRLARDYFIQEAIIRDFQSKGFTLISANENEPDLCSNDPTRILLRTFLGGIAEYEKSMLVAKLWAAKERVRVKTGKYCGGRKGYDATEEGQKIVQYIKTLHRKQRHYKRMTLQEIADRLNTEGVTTLDGKKWSLYRVQAVLKSY